MAPQCTAAAVACLFIASATAQGQSTATPPLGRHPPGRLAEQLDQGRVVLREIRFAPGSDRINDSHVRRHSGARALPARRAAEGDGTRSRGLRQAEIYEKLGEKQKPAEHCRKFVQLWEECDLELRPMVEEARTRLPAH